MMIWCKMFRPTTESVLWLQVPDEIALTDWSEKDSLDIALDYLGNSTGWSFIPMKFFVVNSEKQLESLMESEV
jgi:hypothetical protein